MVGSGTGTAEGCEVAETFKSGAAVIKSEAAWKRVGVGVSEK